MYLTKGGYVGQLKCNKRMGGTLPNLSISICKVGGSVPWKLGSLVSEQCLVCGWTG